MKNIIFFCIIVSVSPIFGMEEAGQISHDENELNMLQGEEFFQAVETNNIDTVKKLIIDEKIFPLDHKNREGDTALTIAVKKNYVDMARELSLIGFNIYEKNNIGQTPLALAINAKKSAIVELLLDNTLDIKNLGGIDMQDNEGNTPLMLAVKSEDPTIVQTVLAEVPDYTLTTNKGKTARYFAEKIWGASRDEILVLLDTARPQFDLYKAIVSPQSSDNIQNFITLDVSFYIKNIERNPLAAAIRMNNIVACNILIELGVDVNQILKHNITPLSVAVDKNNLAVVELLLQKGANPNAITKIFGGMTPIFFAFCNDNNLNYPRPLIRNLLVKYGADINHTISLNFNDQPNKMTPLMMVISDEDTSGKECVQLTKELLELRADPSLKNSEGQTALDIIRERVFPDDEVIRQFEIIDILQKATQKQSDLLLEALHKN